MFSHLAGKEMASQVLALSLSAFVIWCLLVGAQKLSYICTQCILSEIIILLENGGCSGKLA